LVRRAEGGAWTEVPAGAGLAHEARPLQAEVGTAVGRWVAAGIERVGNDAGAETVAIPREAAVADQLRLGEPRAERMGADGCTVEIKSVAPRARHPRAPRIEEEGEVLDLTPGSQATVDPDSVRPHRERLGTASQRLHLIDAYR